MIRHYLEDLAALVSISLFVGMILMGVAAVPLKRREGGGPHWRRPSSPFGLPRAAGYFVARPRRGFPCRQGGLRSEGTAPAGTEPIRRVGRKVPPCLVDRFCFPGKDAGMDDRPIKLFHAPAEEMSPAERTHLLELAMMLSRRYSGIAKVVMIKLPPKDADE